MPNKINAAPKKEFQERLTVGIVIITLFFLVPFGISHLLDGRTVLGLSILGFSLLVSFLIWLNSINSTWTPAAKMSLALLFSVFFIYLINDQGSMILFWSSPAIIIFHFALPFRQGFIASSFFAALVFPTAWDILEPGAMLRFSLALISVSFFSAYFIYVIGKQQKLLKKLAITDTLTGLLNRVILQEKLDNMIKQYQRLGSDMTLVSIDLDHFKRINDQFGHDQGDAVLIGVSDYLKQRIRGVDLVFRIGGEEFLLLLFNCNTQAATRVAEEIRKHIETLTLAPNLVITASFGIAGLKPSETQKDWLKRSDQNLYLAKENGRNQVVA